MLLQITVRAANGAGMHYDTDPGANVFHNATLRNMLYTTWKHVAEHYRSWDYIAAYDRLPQLPGYNFLRARIKAREKTCTTGSHHPVATIACVSYSSKACLAP